MKSLDKGFTLVEILVAVAVLGGIALGVIQLLKTQSNTSVRARVSGDMAQLHSQIISYLASPAYCNANFYNKPTGTLLSATGNQGGSGSGTEGIYICNTANCAPGTTQNVLPAQTASWLKNATKISGSLRIASVKYSVSSTSTTSLTDLKLDVVFETNRADGIKQFPKSFYASVVVNGNTILGCPQATGSTVVY